MEVVLLPCGTLKCAADCCGMPAVLCGQGGHMRAGHSPVCLHLRSRSCVPYLCKVHTVKRSSALPSRACARARWLWRVPDFAEYNSVASGLVRLHACKSLLQHLWMLQEILGCAIAQFQSQHGLLLCLQCLSTLHLADVGADCVKMTSDSPSSEPDAVLQAGQEERFQVV